MCGIIGCFTNNSNVDRNWLLKARDMMKYRGPDNGGYWESTNSNVLLGHRRLSIIDLNIDSNQPMVINFNGFEYAITFNGEIYNFEFLKNDLFKLGVTFRTGSDTEVLLMAYIYWGFKCINRLEGMFSFTIYDPSEKTLFFARDRVGEKPFYYFQNEGSFYFSSEFLPLFSHPALNREISIASIQKYLEFGFLSETQSFNLNIHKLPAGNFGIYNLETDSLSIQSYYNIPNPNKNLFSFSEALHKFESIIEESVKNQLRSDVPVGVLLSGGIDSSIVTCVANSINSNIVNYTVDFGNNEEELNNAKIISNFYGCHHEVFQFKALDINKFDYITSRIDDPISDSSFLPTFLISEMIAESGGKVVLGGDGADELFGGYSIYKNITTAQKLSKNIPSDITKFISNFIDSPYKFNNIKSKKWLLNLNILSNQKLPNIRQVFTFSEINELLNKKYPIYNMSEYSELFNYNNSNLFNLSVHDLKQYFGSNILLKNDRASMLNSIEMRAPFLSKDMIDFAYTDLSDDDKIFNGKNKYLLIEYSKKIFPPGYNYNKKRGFNFTNNLILETRWFNYFYSVITATSLFNIDYVNYLFKQAKSGANYFFQKIYTLFIISKWTIDNSVTIV
jgi:asparagine synthase (glutamine-hydrolysing)